MTGIVTPLSDLFADSVTAQPGATGAFGGEWTASGTALVMPAYISGRNRLVRSDNTGEEVVSRLKITVGITEALVAAWIATGWTGWIDQDWIAGDAGVPTILSVEGYRFQLPARFGPRLELEALSIGHSSDEGGAHHETIYF